MLNTIQEFLADATQRVAGDLVEAYLRLPEDKRNWSPNAGARTALDQMAECAVLTGYTADLIASRTWSSKNFQDYPIAKTQAAALPWEKLHAMLLGGTKKAIAAIRAVPDDALNKPIEVMGSLQPLSQVMSHPYWNMSYHLGQINYVASILGCLP